MNQRGPVKTWIQVDRRNYRDIGVFWLGFWHRHLSHDISRPGTALEPIQLLFP